MRTSNNLDSAYSLHESEVGHLGPEVIEDCKNSFLEVGATIALTKGACLFAANSYVSIALVAFTVALLALNIFSRIVAVMFDGHELRDLSDICRIIAPFNMSLIYGTTGNILVHEVGHLGAVSLIHRSAKTQISVDGLFAGSTTWYSCKYTFLGRLLGPMNSQIIIAAAGPIAAVALATLGIILALELSGLNLHLRECIFFSSIFSIIQHVEYALSALVTRPDNLAHDFVSLWQCGVHPIVSAVCLVAIPAIATLGYLYNKNPCSKSN